jgi:hypothetical protein
MTDKEQEQVNLPENEVTSKEVKKEEVKEIKEETKKETQEKLTPQQKLNNLLTEESKKKEQEKQDRENFEHDIFLKNYTDIDLTKEQVFLLEQNESISNDIIAIRDECIKHNKSKNYFSVCVDDYFKQIDMVLQEQEKQKQKQKEDWKTKEYSKFNNDENILKEVLNFVEKNKNISQEEINYFKNSLDKDGAGDLVNLIKKIMPASKEPIEPFMQYTSGVDKMAEYKNKLLKATSIEEKVAIGEEMRKLKILG